jgi:hypothetical protein
MEWPRCVLLLKLATSYASTGRTQGCEKLTARLDEWRTRMAGAPPIVQLLLRELSHVAWLLGRGDLKAARHHASQAERKAREVEALLQKLQLVAARSRSFSGPASCSSTGGRPNGRPHRSTTLPPI